MSKLKEYSTEIKVGALFFTALVLAGVFLWLLGDYTPIGRTYNIYVQYNFAGGVELGTPVRLSGIKVGKVTRIEFLDPAKAGKVDEVSLKLKLNISRTVRHRVRKDSMFFVNQAGIIGERYVEITAGTEAASEIASDETVRGVDPPRFDQMLSQGMDVFGEVSKIIEKNKAGIETTLAALTELGKVMNELIGKLDEEDVRTLKRILYNVDDITEDLRVLTNQMRYDLGPTLTDARELIQNAGPVLNQANQTLTDADALVKDLRPMVEDANKIMKNADSLLARADKLLKEVDEAGNQFRDMPKEKKDKLKNAIDRMTDTVTQLQDVVARLDKFTAMVETQYSDMDRAKIEKVLRDFFQQEGIRINVGEVKFRDKDDSNPK